MLKSMRSRITLRFVLLLIPFLLGTSYMVVMISTNAAEREAWKSFDLLKVRAMNQMKAPDGSLNRDWKEKLDQLVEGTTFRQNQAGILVKDRDESVVYSSSIKDSKPPAFLWQSR